MRRRRFDAGADLWPAFTDVLSGMLLVMVFALTLFAVMQTGLVQVVGGKDAALRALEEQAAELRALLAASEDRAESLAGDLLAATELIDRLGADRDRARSELDAVQGRIEEDRTRIADLARRLREYVEQVKELNARLSAAEEVAENREASIADLQSAVNRLRAQLATLSSELSEAERSATEQKLRVSELLVEMARKDQRISELERLERYRSEFLEKLSAIFADNPNVRVVGDRFVFQSEVLFESGSARVGESGQRELDKVARALRELLPRVPEGLAVNVQVQGHTDTDPLVSTDDFADNWELSTARALEVVHFLASRGIPEDTLSAAGFGEHFPRVRGRSAQAKSQNRRIEIRITQL